MKKTIGQKNKIEIARYLQKCMRGKAMDLDQAKRELSLMFGLPMLKNSELLDCYKFAANHKAIAPNFGLLKALKKRAVRTLSGVAPVAVLTMPFPCPGSCAFCPSEKGVPQSYLSNEPAVMRAIRCDYNPYYQVHLRLQALENNGHLPTKIELIVIGGTWSVLPKKYKYWYIGKCFEAANQFGAEYKNVKCKMKNYNAKLKIDNLKKYLSKEQVKNEGSKYKIVGLTLETRPDHIDEKELLEMRELGCTRVELGVQAIDDGILKQNRRGHGVGRIAEATALLKQYGFKVTYHLMPGLPGSTPSKDLKMFKRLWSDQRFQPDQIKFYPTVVTRGSLLYRWWKAGKYKPYSEKQLRKLIVECKKAIPPYVRIIRLIRDIPEESIIAGNRITNLRQIMQNENIGCGCIRCREVGNKKLELRNLKLGTIKYCASSGTEYFISYTGKDGKSLFGFCRLRLPEKTNSSLPKVLEGAAIIRELHVYGELTPIGSKGKIQHAGLGKKLLSEAERIACQNGHKTMAVISGIGVRGYYRKLGYRLNASYMVKALS